MSCDNVGMSRCSHCGAEYRLFTIFNRDMQGLTKAWKNRHEFACAKRTPEERLKWAKPYIGKDRYESSIVVDLSHKGFQVKKEDIDSDYQCAEEWYDELVRIATSHNNANSVRDFDGWTHDWELHSPSDVYYTDFPEHLKLTT